MMKAPKYLDFILFSLVAALFLLPVLVEAQDFEGGITAGFASSQVAGDGYAGFNKAGVSGGFFVRLPIAVRSGLQMELSYIQKGSRYNEKADQPLLQQYVLRLNYVQLPLLYQYDIGKLRLEAGLSLDFLIGKFEEKNYLENTLNDWRKLTFNTVFGVQYRFTQNWALGLRTINSINSIRKNSVEGNVKRYGNTFGAFNDVLQMSLFYQF